MDQELGLREGETFSQVTQLVTELVSLTLKSAFPAPFLLSQPEFPQGPVAKASTVSGLRDSHMDIFAPDNYEGSLRAK